MPERDIIAGLDIGTSKVCAIIAERGQFGEVSIIGVGTSPSHGLKKGMVVNLDKTVQAISAAVDSAQRMAGVPIESVYVGIAGGHISSFNSHGVVAVINENEITERDVKRVIDAAKVVAIPNDRQIIHVIPRDFTVDTCRGIKDPEGMAGKRLEVVVHIVTGAVAAIQNMVKCVERAGLVVEDLILQPIASCTSVLTPEEQDCATVLIDIGGGTTDLAVTHEGSIIHTAVIPVGGDHFTQDLAFGLRIPFAEAERLKLRYSQPRVKTYTLEQTAATAIPGEYDYSGQFFSNLPEVERDKIASIVKPRAEEVFLLVKKELANLVELGIAPIQCVLTGGASQLPEMEALAQEILGLPVRIGNPESAGGMADYVKSPIYATAIGLVQYACQNSQQNLRPVSAGSGFWADLLLRVKRWFKDFIPLD